jgi:hypothetical protein
MYLKSIASKVMQSISDLYMYIYYSTSILYNSIYKDSNLCCCSMYPLSTATACFVMCFHHRNVLYLSSVLHLSPDPCVPKIYCTSHISLEFKTISGLLNHIEEAVDTLYLVLLIITIYLLLLCHLPLFYIHTTRVYTNLRLMYLKSIAYITTKSISAPTITVEKCTSNRLHRIFILASCTCNLLHIALRSIKALCT